MIARLSVWAGIILLLFSGYLYYQRLTPSRLQISSYKEAHDRKSVATESAEIESPAKVASPIAIDIPAIATHLPIIPANIQNGKWETTADGVSYLQSSPIPGETGNSILYGHNWEKLLGKLPSIKPKDEIVITYDDGSKKHFRVEYTGVVEPDQLGILNQTPDVRLTIYTCVGFLDSHRFIAVAFPAK